MRDRNLEFDDRTYNNFDRPQNKESHMAPTVIPTTTPTTAAANQPGVIYVGRSDGEQIAFLGKVGMVETPDSLEGRVRSYLVADRLFGFVLEAAYAVDFPETSTIGNVESYVHSILQGEGLFRIRENFEAPDCNMTFLARRVEAALNQLGHPYRALDVDVLRTRAQELNSATWGKLRNRLLKPKKGKVDEPNIYQEWLYEHCRVYPSMQALARPRDYVRQVLAAGYLLRDLAAGSGLERIEVSMHTHGDLRIYPTSLSEALFEAKAEADLALASTTSYTVHPTSPSQIPTQPLAMSIIVGQTLERLEIAGAFVATGKAPSEKVQMTPDHAAALGHLGGAYNEQCLYEGLGVRARLPLDLYEVVRGRPHLLAGIRFWQGIQHAREQGFRIQDFDLPMSTMSLWDRAFEAAEELERIGRPVPASVRQWVSHVWLPTALSGAGV